VGAGVSAGGTCRRGGRGGVRGEGAGAADGPGNDEGEDGPGRREEACEQHAPVIGAGREGATLGGPAWTYVAPLVHAPGGLPNQEVVVLLGAASSLRMTSPPSPTSLSPLSDASAADRGQELRVAVPMPEDATLLRRLLGELPAPLLTAIDLVVILLAGAMVPGSVTSGWRLALGTAVFVGLWWQRAQRHAAARMRPTVMTRAIVVGTAAATVVVLAARSLTAGGPPAEELLRLGVVTGVLLAVVRAGLQLAARRARRLGAGTIPTLIVGAGVIGRQLERRMRQHPELGFLPIGFLDDDPAPLPAGVEVAAMVLGPTASLPEVLERTGARHVVFSFTRAPDSEVLPLLRECQRLGIDVSVMPRLFENVNGRVRVEQLAGLPLLALRQTDPRSWQFAVKHASDRLFAATMLIVLSPLLALVALIVKVTTPGPVLYRQERVGRDGRSFRLLKFRSMRPGGVSVDQALIDRLEIAGLGPGGIEGEDRRTPFGRFLRRSGLDELPQLVNVVRGEMSLVGPRPERPEFADRFGERLRRYDDRHLVRAGITGWAQVNGLRGQTSIAERIEWDNWYIQNWSLGLDLLTIVLTPLAILHTPKEEASDVARAGTSAEG
jgi:exopolysaccharide biosynthesis polyprenyl glycosylphosphotransferase